MAVYDILLYFKNMWRIILLLNFFFFSLIWCHHCEDKEDPFKKVTNCPVNQTHYCHNRLEDLSSFSCRCTSDASCKEPCGINTFRAWSSSEGSWIRTIPKANRVPAVPLSEYAKCVKVPGTKPKAPHKEPYTMCMCNDHYYSYDYLVTDDRTMKGFTHQFLQKLHNEKPRMYLLGVAEHQQNLPYLNTDKFAYRKCVEVSTGESYHPPGWLGFEWCNLTFCQEHSPFGKESTKEVTTEVKYRVMKCAETCTCFLQTRQNILDKARERNKLVDEFQQRKKQQLLPSQKNYTHINGNETKTEKYQSEVHQNDTAFEQKSKSIINIMQKTVKFNSS